jgi:ATP-binding cassette, subfamily B, multidrug efflux pump
VKGRLFLKSLQFIRPYLYERRRVILLGIACLIIVDVLQLYIPRIIKRAVDGLTLARIDAPGLLADALLIAAMGLLIGVFRYGWRQCLLGTSRRVEEGLRNALFRHLQTLSPAYFDRVRTGDLMAHATNDIMQVRMATGMGMVALNDALVMGTAAIGFMAFINLRLTLFVLIPMPFIVFGTRIFSRKMHHRYQAVQGAFSELTEAVRERLAGIRVIKAGNREESEALRLEAISSVYIRKNIHLVKITGAFFPMMALFTNLSLAIVLFLGGRQTILGTITPGDFVAFISYLWLLTWPMMAMGWVTNLIQRGAASLGRIGKILDTRPDIRERPDAGSLAEVQGEIVFDRVNFGYDETGEKVLADIDLRIRPGQVLGVVGPQGSGKTSLVSLIPRIYDAGSGQVRLDGHDVRDLRLAGLRAHVCFMAQEPFIFAGTVRENITFGDPSADGQRLARVLEAAALADTVAGLPHGLETRVGERGVILSGGQKQRIALARALFKPAPVMILDDPISQVDMQTGAKIAHTLRALAGRHTLVVVSHRLAAVRFADQIIVMADGRIAARGTHAALLGQGGYYARTYRLQEFAAPRKKEPLLCT